MKITRRRQALLLAEIVALRSTRRPGAQRLRLFARDRIKPVAFVYSWALRPGTGRAPSRSVGTRSVGTSFQRRVVSVFHVSMYEKIIDAPQHKQSPAEPQRDLVQFAFHQGFVLTGFDPDPTEHRAPERRA